MIIGFGFGSPLTSVIMLVITSAASYLLYRLFFRPSRRIKPSRDDLRRYYHEQRDLARKLSREFDVSDEDIEARVEREMGPRNP